jgi:predicted MPP superfamily phosphohydrolase
VRRRPWAFLVFLTLLLGVLGSAHDYFLQRLVRDTSLPEPWATWLTLGIVSGGLLIVAHPIGERSIGPKVGRILGWPAYLWLGTSFYLLLGLGVTDLALAAADLGGQGIARTRASYLGALLFGTLAYGASSALRLPAVKDVEVRIEGWPAALDGYRIVQISDIHIGSLIGGRFARRLVRRCNALDADLLAITGDLVDGSVRHLGDHVRPFGELRARDGVYFVTGNHDYYSGAERWVAHLQELGIRVLRNRRIVIERDTARFALAGVDDLSSARLDAKGGHDLDAALRDWDPALPLVLLAHHPASFEQAQPRGVHLQLSGHTHGGQIWPFRFFVRLQTRYLAGLYRRGRSQLYVSRGTGYWGPPLRVLEPAEVTRISIRPA